MIREAYFELLREKPIDKITIAQICEIADIHRGTFYQHYHDIYELQEKIEEELMAKFDEVMPMIENGKSDVAEALVRSIFDEKDNCRAILGENGSSDFLKKLIEKCRKSAYVKYEALGINRKHFGAVYTFVTSGCIGVIREWVMNDFQEKPDTVIETIRKASSQGIQGFIRQAAQRDNWATFTGKAI